MKAVIVGRGRIKFSKHEALRLKDLIVAAACEALNNAGIPATAFDAI